MTGLRRPRHADRHRRAGVQRGGDPRVEHLPACASTSTNGFPFRWRIVIADNASTDDTAAIAARLAGADDRIVHLHLDQKGRGRALRAAWSTSDADVVAYTDVDLSTGLTGLLPLVAPLVSGHSDLAIGSRLSSSSVVARGPKRELISRCYNQLLRLVFAVRFRDAQCGFKAGRADVVQLLLPAVEDEAWFFDTELLLLAEYNGLRVHEVPVDWIDDPDSRVDVRSTAMADLRGVRRMAWRFARGRAGGRPRRARAAAAGRRLRPPDGHLRRHRAGLDGGQPRDLPAAARPDRRRVGQRGRVHRHGGRQQLGQPALDVPPAQRRGSPMAAWPRRSPCSPSRCSAPRSRWPRSTGTRPPSSSCWRSAWTAAAIFRFVVLRQWVYRR